MNKPQLLRNLEARGFSKSVLASFARVKRENFIPENVKDMAYEDMPLPIGKNQTISQPHTIAMMLDLLNLKKGQKILELGSGSGYVLALISEMIGNKGKVFGMEIIKELAEFSKNNIKDYKNVEVYHKSGKNGLKQKAPFDRILISAAIEEIPRPILEQLKNNGLLVAPVGVYGANQDLIVIQRIQKRFLIRKKIPGFVFVKFI